MQTRIVEVTNNNLNWGKFLVGVLDVEWERKALIEGKPSDRPLLRILGWDFQFVWVLDLQTGEGAYFRVGIGSNAKADLDNHRIWVCPMFEPFLIWLYANWKGKLELLPETLNLPEAVKDFALSGYRRPGPDCQPAKGEQ